MELRKEYQEIANTHGFGLSSLAREQIKLAVRDCQALADRQMKKLTDAEIDGKPKVFDANANLELTIWEWLEPDRNLR